jgi:hypothetical protein
MIPALKKIKTVKPFYLLGASGTLSVQSLQHALNNGVGPLVELLEQMAATRLPQALLMASEWLAVPENLSQLIYTILNNPEASEKMLKESYYHQNGFDKIVLLSGKGFKLRLHHFHARPGHSPMENIHDHRWAFASTMIRGSFKMHLFEEDPKGEEERTLHNYNAAKVNQKYATEEMGKRRLKIVERLQYAAGDSYIMLPDELHSIIHIPNQEAITLIVTGNNERETCKLYAKGPIEDEQKEMEPFEKQWLFEKLENIVRHPYRKAS